MIGVTVLRPWLLLLLLLAPAMYLAWRRWTPPLAPGRGRLALGLRLAVITLLVLALAGVRMSTVPQQRGVVAVVDLSASLRAGEPAEAAAVQALAGARGPDDLFGVVTFGRDAQVEMPLTRTPAFDGFQTSPDAGYTDIGGALQLAANLIPEGYARQLVLISDGRENLGDAAAAVASLRSQGVRVDVLPVGAAPSQEVLVQGVDVPPEVRQGQSATVTVRLQSTGAATGKLVLSLDGQELEARDVSLPAGSSSQVFHLPSLDPGVYRVRAELSAQPDTYSENNVGEGVIRVLGRPTVLVLEYVPGEAANVVAGLTAAGMTVETRPVSQMPTDPSALARYESTVVVDVPASAFPTGGMAALAGSVRDLGRGLVTIGGSLAYGPGGWQGTPLEAALPVTVDPPKRNEKPKVALALVLETMESPAFDAVARGAAEKAIDALQPTDDVVVTNGAGGFAVPLTSAADKAAIHAALEGSVLGDPESYAPSIKLAGEALAHSDASIKHIIVVGDGDAATTGYQPLFDELKREGVTISTVGVNYEHSASAMAMMADIARYGGGRFYQADDPSQIPELYFGDSQTALRPWFEQQPFFPHVTSSGDLLEGVPLDAFPQLGGYVVTTPRSAAEVYLTSPRSDPVLAAWDYGLGRSVAWTSDAAGRWTGDLLRSAVAGPLFGRMVAWTLPDAAPAGLRLEAVPSGDGLSVTVTGPEQGSGVVEVAALGPGGVDSRQELTPVGPGRWQGQVTASQVGTYVLHAVLERGGQVAAQSEIDVSVPYSAEYLELGRDQGFLRLLAREGGSLLSRPGAAWKLPTLPVLVSTDIFWLLLLLAVLLWPIDIAVRRLMLSPRQLLAVARSVATLRRPAQVELAVPSELARLTQRVGRRRGGHAPAGQRAVGAERTTPATPGTTDSGGDAPRPTGDTDPPAAGDLAARLLEKKRLKQGGGG